MAVRAAYADRNAKAGATQVTLTLAGAPFAAWQSYSKDNFMGQNMIQDNYVSALSGLYCHSLIAPSMPFRLTGPALSCSWFSLMERTLPRRGTLRPTPTTYTAPLGEYVP